MKLLILVFLSVACSAFGGVKVAPPFSEFSVIYPSEPKIKVISFMADDGAEGEAIRTELMAGDNLLRAEFTPITERYAFDYMGNDEMRSRMLEYARHNGLKVSHAVIEMEHGIRVAVLRATKLMGEDDLAVTFLVKTYYGNRSVIIISVAAESAEYPTAVTSAFLKSAKRSIR